MIENVAELKSTKQKREKKTIPNCDNFLSKFDGTNMCYVRDVRTEDLCAYYQK